MKYVDRSLIRRLQDAELISLLAFSAEELAEIEDGTRVDTSQLQEMAKNIRSATSQPSAHEVVRQPYLSPEGGTSASPYKLRNEGTFGGYWEAWKRFTSHWFSAAESRRVPDYPFNLVFRGILALGDLNFQEARSLLDQLWNDRWILESLEAGRLIGALETSFNIPQDATRLSRLTEQVMTQVRELKDNVSSLAAWFQGVRDVAPDVAYGFHLSRQLNDNKANRLFDEMLADLGGIVLQGGLLDALTGAVPFIEHLDGNSARDLRYKFNARIIYPRFWYERALTVLGSNVDNLPPEMIQYDRSEAVACAAAESIDNSLFNLGWSLPRLED
ncbi:hypothetical protein [Sinomonas sp. ASV322]|uniref:hypothetical protein n=1 Tax=Sinomonas sp. ASV322 TaxID=3041920 RepID=UPI0027DC6550|nr:hypothetical protein [Sinomonas sp. ASV322]MDQ4502197.1 hypothetical protein [Sinomonas sp. ASV322]